MKAAQPDLESALKANIWKMKAYWFCHSLIFAYVIERLFGLERGLNVQDMVKVEIFYALCSVLLEVPTGALADRWNRRNTMILSAICIFFEFYFLIGANSIYGFLASSFAAALGGALASGTANALLYDSLLVLKQEQNFEKHLGQIRVSQGISGLIGGLGGAWAAAHYGLVSTYYLSLVGVSLAFAISLLFKEAPRHRHLDDSADDSVTSSDPHSYWHHMWHALKVVFQLPGLAKIIFYAALFSGVLGYVDEYYQIYAKEIGLAVIWFGAWLGLYMLFETLCGSISYRFKTLAQSQHFWTILIALSGLSLWSAALTQNRWGLGLLLIALGFYWVMEPLALGLMHQQIPSSHRATIESWSSLFQNVMSMTIGLGFGWIADYMGIFTAYDFLAWILVCSVLLWMFWSKGRNDIQSTQINKKAF